MIILINGAEKINIDTIIRLTGLKRREVEMLKNWEMKVWTILIANKNKKSINQNKKLNEQA